MKVLNLLTAGGFGGIETYCRNIGLNAAYENGFCFLFGKGRIYDLMLNDRFEVISLADGHKISFYKFFKLIEIAKRYDVIVVHHSDPFLQAYYLVLKFFYPNKKYIRVFHSCFSPYMFQGYGFIKRFLYTLEHKIVVAKSDLIISVSHAVEESYSTSLKKYPHKLKVIYNGIGSNLLDKGVKAEFILEPPVQLLYIGRLSSEKGVINLIDALSRVNFDFMLYIVGDGNERERLQTRVNELGLSSRVSFEGSQSDVGQYIARCNIFIYPTLWEAFGISLVEAMAYGRVCVANAVGGIPEIIEDKVNGFLVKNLSVDSLAHKLEEAVDALDSSEKIRKNARKTAERFSIKRACKELQRSYSELCGL